MILPKTIEIANCFDIREAVVRFPGPGFYYVSGKWRVPGVGIRNNGAGKTTFLLTLWHALTGLELPDFKVGDIAEHAERAWTRATLSGTSEIVIERVRTKSDGVVSTFTVNGVDERAKRNTSMTQQRIEEVLRSNFDLLPHTHYLFQLSTKAGFLYDTDAARKKIVGTLFKTADIAGFTEDISKAFSKAKEKLAAQSIIMASLQGQASQLETGIAGLQSQLQSLVEPTIKSPEAIAEEEAAWQAALSISQGTLETAKTRWTSWNQAMEANGQKREALSRQGQEVAQQQATRAAQVQSATVEVERLIRVLEQPAEECPTCGQIVSDKQRVNEKCEIAMRTMATLSNQDAALQAKLGQLREQLAKVVKEGETLAGFRDGVVKAYQAANAPVMVAQQALGRLRALKENPPVSPRASLEQALQRALGLHVEVRQKLADGAERLKRRQSRVSRLEFWLKAHRHDIRARAFQGVAEQLTQLVRPTLSRLYADLLEVEFDSVIEDGGSDKFSVLLRHQQKPDVLRDARRVSGAEKAVVNLAIMLALREFTRSELGILFIDEALEALDAWARPRVMEVLEELARDNVILFVTHDPSNLPRDRTRVIEVVRENGVVTIEQS